MASILLSSAASSIGLGGVFGKLAGSFIGRAVDFRIFGSDVSYHSHGYRLRDYSIQSSSYGSIIPIVYGTVRTAGNIIWAKEIKEKAATNTATTRTKGGKINRMHTDHSYFASLAVSICEGEIDEVIRIWADERVLDLSVYKIRIYKGTEDQLPDPLIEADIGIDKVPAYRGQAYVVLEDFPLAEFNNRLPNFNFEVKRNVRSSSVKSLEEKIESIVIIPGGGEFVYDTVAQKKTNGRYLGKTFAQTGAATSINQHTTYGKANALVSLDQLKNTLPNVKWVSVVVNWFGSSLKAGDCKVLPGVEFKGDAITAPDTWQVCGRSRENAHLISKLNNKPQFGGTINDASLLRYLKELKSRGYKVLLCPMIFMDMPGKPWRGKISGAPSEIKKFFENNGYNEFIKHYASISRGLIDAFLIGSELIGITKVQDDAGVNQLINLAKEVKELLCDTTKVSYAADWSEYHHAAGGWYNLDKLWASEYIDFIGIDAYFPLTNKNESEYDVNKIADGWKGGEGCEFYFEDLQKKSKKPLSKEYAWKNIKWWWENEHVNPDGQKTLWKPKSKKIWFTEYGFPSVDCTTNQPNVFFDETTNDSALPIHSKGIVDFKAQRAAIEGTELVWENSEMVENKFLWCWDARPYPYWPDDKRIWSDGSSYIKGHWVQGKLGASKLSDVIEDLSSKCDLETNELDTKSLNDNVEGLIIDSKRSTRSILDLLRSVYFFDPIEKNGIIAFEKRTEKKILNIKDGKKLGIKINANKADIADLPSKVDINFINKASSYKVWNKHSTLAEEKNSQSINLNLPIVMSEGFAEKLSEIILYDIWQSGTHYNFELSPKYCYLSVGDVVLVKYNNKKISLRITSIHLGANLVSKITAVKEESSLYTTTLPCSSCTFDSFEPLSKTRLEILDIPYIEKPENENDLFIYLAACGYGKNWPGAKILVKNSDICTYEDLEDITSASIIGNVLSEISEYEPCVLDNKTKIIVSILSGQIESVSENMFLSGYNKALIGDEIIFFKTAKLISEFQYELSGLIRGMYGTESEIKNHEIGERFVVLDESIKKIRLPLEAIGQSQTVKAVTFNDSILESEEMQFRLQGNCLKTYKPVDVEINGTRINWKRRSRIASFLPNYSEVPLGEMFEQYSVSAYDQDGQLKLITTTSVNEIELDFAPSKVEVTQLATYQ